MGGLDAASASLPAALLAGLVGLLAAPLPAHAQGIGNVATFENRSRAVQPISDLELIELAERSCYERITREDRVLPDDVRIQTARRQDFRVIVSGFVRQPPPGGPMAFVCAVSGFGGTGGSIGQVFNLQYTRIEGG